ncbi:MAG: hypothetical protein AB1Z19_01055 [Eubacteriales bacterium]
MTTNRIIKSAINILLILVFAVSFIACAEAPQVAYDNFVTDLDILYRLEQTAFNVEFGRYSETWQRDIKAIIVDLETCTVEDEEAVRINNMFIKSARAFLEASQLFLEGSDQARQEGYDKKNYAESKYREATAAYQAYIIVKE